MPEEQAGAVARSSEAEIGAGAARAFELAITAERLVRRSDVVLTPDDDLATALRRCQSRHEQNIPVVRSRDDPEVVGEVRLTDLIRAYNQALLLARAQEHGRG